MVYPGKDVPGRHIWRTPIPKSAALAASETYQEHMATYSWDVFYECQDSGFPVDCGTGVAADDLVEDTGNGAGSPTFLATGALPGLSNAIDFIEPDNDMMANGVALSGLTKANMDANGITGVFFCRARTDGQNGGYLMGATGFAGILSFKSDGDMQVRIECNGTNCELLTTSQPMTTHYTNDDDIMVAFVCDTSFDVRLWKGFGGTLTEITEGQITGVSGYHNNWGTASRIWSFGGLVGQPRSLDGLYYAAYMSAQFQASTAQLQAMLDASGF